LAKLCKCLCFIYISVLINIYRNVYVFIFVNVFISVLKPVYVHCYLNNFVFIFYVVYFDNDLKGQNSMANYLSSISAAMTEVVKLLLQLVKVCGEAKASSSVAQGSAVKFKAEFDEELLNKLKNKKLLELFQDLLA